MRMLLLLLFVSFFIYANGHEKFIKVRGQFLRISFIDTTLKESKDFGLFFVPAGVKKFDIDALLKAKHIYYLDLGLPLSDKIDSLLYLQSQLARLKTVYSHGETFYDSVRIQMAKGVLEVVETKGLIVSKYFLPGSRDFRMVIDSRELYVRPETVLDIIGIR